MSVIGTRVRAWVFTFNNPDGEEDIQIFKVLKGEALSAKGEQIQVRYSMVSYEIGEQCGTLHMQGYIYFKHPQYGKYVSTILPRCRLDVAHGTPDENKDYIVGPYTDKLTGKTKPYNEDHWIFGEPPVKGRATFDKIKLAMVDPMSNMQMYTQYRKSYREVMSLQIDLDKLREVKVIQPIDRFNTAKEHIRNGQTVCTDILLYNAEQILFFDLTEDPKLRPQINKLIEWKNGIPPMIKYGYEYIRLDPDIVYIMVQNDPPVQIQSILQSFL